MKKRKIIIRKTISFISGLLLVLQSIGPSALFITQVHAQAVTPTEEVTPTIDPTPTIAPTITEIPTPTEEVTPTPEQGQILDGVSITATPTPTQVPSPWTFENVELNKEYQSGGVTLTFTKLPDPSGNIKIEEITLTQEQIKQTGSLSDKAYDITSDMTDGSFSYNLSLPIPEASKGKAVEVKFAEELSNIGSAAKVENTLTKTDTSVSVIDLNHFTIFVITNGGSNGSVTPPSCSGAIGSVNSVTIAGSDQCFNSIQAAIASASAGATINVAAGIYTEVGQIVIDKNLSIVGADKTTTIIKPAQDTGNDGSGNSRGWFLVNSGESFTLENVTLDGTGKNIHTGIRNLGNTTLTGNIIKNISYPGYFGFAVSSNWEAAGNTLLTVKNNTFSGYGRVGVHIDRGSGTSMGLIDNNIFIGKGEGDHLDYAIEVETGASATITNNDISNNKGITSPPDSYTSAGILATTYFGSGTNITLTDNFIHDNSYGVVLGLGDSSDTTSVLQFDGNIFNSNTYDFDNSTVNNIDARNNTWSVADQNNLDQIEAKINHNCSNSTYIHGVCSGTDDYSAGGMVRYKDIGTPSNLGWNVGSKSSTPNETSLDIACGGYTNENSVAQNWSAVNGVSIKYQREVTFPSNAISNFEAGINTYTPFSSFGSGPGTEGLWKTRVRAYFDTNNNNIYDSGEEVSNWSNECNITFDKTAPLTPTHTSPIDNSYLTTANWTLANWSDETDTNGPVTYIYESSNSNTPKPDGSFISPAYVSLALSSSQISTAGTSQGTYYWHVRSQDALGNASAWSTPWKVTVDNTAPVKPAFTAPTNNLFTHINSVTLTWSDGDDTGTTQSGIKGYTIRYTFVPMGGGSTVSWSSGLRSIGNPKTHSGSYGHGQGTYTFYVSTTDNAGNASPESSSLIVTYDATAPTTPTATPVAGDYLSDQSVTLASSDSGSGLKNIYYTLDGTPPNVSKTLYDGAITVDKNMTIKAIAYDNAGNASEILEAVYNRIAPIISFNTNTTTNGWGGAGDGLSDHMSDGKSDGRSDGMSPPTLPNVLGAFTLAYDGTGNEVLGAETPTVASEAALTPTPTPTPQIGEVLAGQPAGQAAGNPWWSWIANLFTFITGLFHWK